MNRRVEDSISTLRQNLPNHRDTVMVVLFGSQARGDQRPDSDIDILHVVKGNCHRWDQRHFDAIRNALKRVWSPRKKDVNVMVENTRSIKKRWNLYGMMEHRAISEGRIVYKQQPYADRLLGQYRELPDAEAARRWVLLAKKVMNEGARYRVDGRMDYGFSCQMMHDAVDGALRALLLHNGVRFPFVRDCGPLYGMLPDRSVVGPHDMDRIARWGRWRKRGADGGPTDEPQPSPEEYAYMQNAARDIIDRARSIVNGR